MRVVRRVRAGLPDRQSPRKEFHRGGPAGAHRHHHLRLLRRRLQFQGRAQGRRRGAHGAVEGRQGQSRPFLRQGPLRLGLRQPSGPHPEADGARQDHRSVAREVFRNNNTDTCARVCHSPTGYGLSKTFGTSAGTQDFDSVEESDVILVIGANPTDAHPVFASRMKKRLRQGAKLIVIDPRRTDLVRSVHVEAQYHLPTRPGTNVAILNAIAHVVVTEKLVDEAFVKERCDTQAFADWAAFVSRPDNSPEQLAQYTGVAPEQVRGAARLFATGGNGAIYYGLGVTEHSQGTTAVMGLANLAMATGNIGRRGVGVNPLRGQNNVQGSCDMGSFPHEFPGYRHISDDNVRALFEKD